MLRKNLIYEKKVINFKKKLIKYWDFFKNKMLRINSLNYEKKDVTFREKKNTKFRDKKSN